jgi:ABC-2 type transport system permease protein
MILRLGQTTEVIPAWQIALSMVIGFAAVFVAIWAAAKIFRVGVLMYGKPPTPATLIKWIRYA